ncbi:hypothetical protein [Sagittula sp. SSi028]|uniref:hypothetical protein n=1 Tax=Sagittula sp. SSi028 TaxID=3400636 RepID=UPI003AF48070
MADAFTDFRRRETAVRRKHTRMAEGYVTKLDKRTGVYVQVPDNKVSGWSARWLVRLVALFIAFKVMLLTGLGVDTYQTHLATLSDGSPFEQLGAWFLGLDPVTRGLSQIVGTLIG